MADHSISVVQPAKGSTTGSGSSSAYRVSWSSVASARFVKFQLYCEHAGAAGHPVLLEEGTTNSYTFNVQKYWDGTVGYHNGPFVIYTVVEDVDQYWRLAISFESSDENFGTVSPTFAGQNYIPLNSYSNYFSSTATAKNGATFSHWICEETGERFTTETVKVRFVRSVEGYYRVTLKAYFNRPSVTVTIEHDYHHDTVGGQGADSLNARNYPTSEYIRQVYEGEVGESSFNEIVLLRSQGTYHKGDYVQFTNNMSVYARSKGYRIIGWTIRQGTSTENDVFYPTSAMIGYSIPSDYPYGSLTAICHIVDGSLKTLNVVTDTSAYGVGGLSDADGVLNPVDGSSGVGTHGEKIHTKRFLVLPGSSYDLTVEKSSVEACKKDGYAGGYHGYSLDGTYVEDRVEFGDDASGVVVTRSVQIPYSASDVMNLIVFLCSHALICEDDSGSLEYKPSNDRLIYECYAPNQI